MDSTILIENQAASARSTDPSIKQGDAGQYRYDIFRAGVVMDDFRFAPGSLKPGQVLRITR